VANDLKTQYWRGLSACLLLLGALGVVFPVRAQTPTPAMPPATPELELRLKKLETELRCLVCQNQTLAESPAGLAGDLRREIRLLADSGKSNEDIKEFLRARYGDFVLYQPAVNSKTYLLWFGPFVLLLGGGVIAFVMARQRQARAASMGTQPTMSDAEEARANALLRDR
jgi:cytochrome c-type biogenesis protein CcmH